MSLIDWNRLISVTAGFFLSIVAGTFGAYIQRRIDRAAERRPLNQLVNFNAGYDILFVFPHRNETPEAILPRTATEDFLAMNNFISTLLDIGWARKVGVRDTTRVSDADKKHNLLIICSSKSNILAKQLQDHLKKSHSLIYAFEFDSNAAWITGNCGGEYRSKSYDQVNSYSKEGVSLLEMPGKRYEDFAIVTKVENPWNKKTKIMWVAGIRGIGTWGAAECIKKQWRQIYDQLPPEYKSCDFSALLTIVYDNCDITEIRVRHVLILNRPPAKPGGFLWRLKVAIRAKVCGQWL